MFASPSNLMVLTNTQPITTRQQYRRYTGCLLGTLFAFLITLFLCGTFTVITLIFPPPALDIVVMGLDSREGEGIATRTDTIMVVGIKPANFRVSLLSIPRDVFIEVPGYGQQRINTINVLGELAQTGSGPKLLSASIEQSFGIQPDRFIRLDFRAFVELVDAIGGVTIYVERVIEDPQFPTPDGHTMFVRFESGWQTMSGDRALIYARTRYGDDDYGRLKRQQQVTSALTGRLSNPTTWPSVLNILNQYIETDLSLWDMITIAPSLLLSGGRFEGLVIDRDWILPANGHAVPNYVRIAEWSINRFE